MKRALAALIVLASAAASADPSAPAPHKRPAHATTKPAATPPPTEIPTITVGTEKPQPKVVILHGSPRAVVGRPKMDDRLVGLPHHLH